MWLLYSACRDALYLSLFLGTRSLSIIHPPTDTVAFAGSDVILTCGINGDVTGSGDYLEWMEYISGPLGVRIWSSNFQRENIRHPNGSRYEITGFYNLRIRNVSLDDSGSYGCRLLVANGNFIRATLAVVGKFRGLPQVGVDKIDRPKAEPSAIEVCLRYS